MEVWGHCYSGLTCSRVPLYSAAALISPSAQGRQRSSGLISRKEGKSDGRGEAGSGGRTADLRAATTYPGKTAPASTKSARAGNRPFGAIVHRHVSDGVELGHRLP